MSKYISARNTSKKLVTQYESHTTEHHSMLNLVVVPLIKQDWMVCLVYIHSALDSTHKDSFSVMGYRIWGLVLLGYTHAYVPKLDAHVHVRTSGVSPKSGRAVFSCST